MAHQFAAVPDRPVVKRDLRDLALVYVDLIVCHCEQMAYGAVTLGLGIYFISRPLGLLTRFSLVVGGMLAGAWKPFLGIPVGLAILVHMVK